MPIYTPHQLQSLFAGEAKKLGPQSLMTAHKHNRIREMWCAAQFGAGISKNIAPCLIEIEHDDEQRIYDFHLHLNNKRLPFQLVEAPIEGRKRTLEYKTNTHAQISQMYKDAPFQDATSAIERVKKELAKKVHKFGGDTGDLHSLVYLNTKAKGVTSTALRTGTSGVADQFASTWVITSLHICCIWNGGHWPDTTEWQFI